jgi:hypothetical protein
VISAAERELRALPDDLQAWLTASPSRIAEHKINNIDALLP